MKKFTISSVTTRISKAREQRAIWAAYNDRLDALKATLDAKVVEADAVAVENKATIATPARCRFLIAPISFRVQWRTTFPGFLS